ncbi:hypothetical protein [Sebaldella sp. S0638]|uniref:hypothetical protein n=1 Tax=Sebaldella sp. S0638 TaxID=2957809 RepID=UPI0020A22BA5|nr:hypothetical protein [Sebaldella sp. S0638]MCP1224538.1 hypothetical protein [Sebaldella sp. S0638]
MYYDYNGGIITDVFTNKIDAREFGILKQIIFLRMVCLAVKNKANFITAKEAFEGSTQKGESSDSIECLVTAKQKRIPSNVDQKAEGGMLTCEDTKYRVYVGNDRKYNLMSVGDRYGFQVRWIESNLYYFYVDIIGGTL